MIACLAWLAVAAHAGVSAVDHRGRPEGDGIAWTSTLRVWGGSPVRFAVPIPREQVRSVDLAQADWEEDHLVGLRPLPIQSEVQVETFQPDRDGARPALVLDRAAPQQISLETLRFRADRSLGVTDRVGWSGGEGIGTSERRQALHGLGRAWKHRHGATVVIVDRPTGALAGTLEPAGRVSLAVVLGAVAAAFGLLGALFGAHRLLDALARRERIDSYFAEVESRARTESAP